MTQKNSRSVHGILLVDKPQGLTSNQVLQQVKKLYRAEKAGHTGSLDPMATGMLPICFGEATKLSQYLLEADKYYKATGLLGQKTNTGDAMGELVAQVDSFEIEEVAIKNVLPQFRGPILQTPSMYSALKFQGRPLYHYARQGKTLDRPARPVTIYQLELAFFDGKQFGINVLCSKGTYIRNLVEDIGEALKVGAHVTRLHRAYTAGFANQTMYSLERLKAMEDNALQACLLPVETAIAHFPKLELTSEEAIDLRHGKVVQKCAPCGGFALYTQGLFIGLGDVQANQLRVRRLLNNTQAD